MKRAARTGALDAGVAQNSAPVNGAIPVHDEVGGAALVVAIGASAGGLQAFATFLDHTPVDSGMAFILAQHLNSQHKSYLADLLRHHTTMPIEAAANGARLLPDRVFVIPPGVELTVTKGRLKVRPMPPHHGHRTEIDTLFSSLAADQGERAVGIVLSGTGSDGSTGVRAIKEHGGITLAQADVGLADTGSMPRSAAATGMVDHVLPVEEMPAKLAAHRRHIARQLQRTDVSDEDLAGQIDEICALLNARTGHFFGQYKHSTLFRRIQRRMQVLQAETAAAYVGVLRRDPHEVELLFREFLISVTEFFRDPAAFEALQKRVILPMLQQSGPELIRIWVPACATGEEVYSVAILVREAMEQSRADPAVQIFGTDLDDRAVSFARRAHYRKPAGLSEARLKLWFTEQDGIHTPVPAVREMCIFSTHNVTKDPPFSKIDLIACRNLPIYMNNDLQDQIIKAFHFALNADGGLFLGPSEGIGRESRLFRMLDKRHKIFRRLGGKAVVTSDIPARTISPRAATSSRIAGAEPPLPIDEWLDKGAQAVLSRHLPAYVVVDSRHRVWRVSSSAAGRYVDLAAGARPMKLSAILAKPLRAGTQAALKKSVQGGEPQLRTGVVLEIDGRKRSVTVTVDPIARKDKDGETFYVIAFQDDGVEDQERSAGRGRALVRELEKTRVQLTATVADLENANEELTSINEEQQSLNEELQSSLEELETSKEELQSVNEELQTVNAELLGKNDQLAKLNSDFKNLLDSTQIATVFLDQELVIKNFTPGMAALFNLRDIDVGRPITDIASRVDYPDLRDDVSSVLKDLSMVEREVRVPETGAIFLLRVRPYRTIDDAVDGVVLTFIDIADRKRAEERYHFLAEHDGLTGLPNRTLLDSRLARALTQAAATDRHIAVLYIDLDRFKTVNDVLGHQIGDKLLQLVAARLKGVLRDIDMAARLGGDEFGVVLAEMAGEVEAAAFADRIIEAVGAPYKVDGHEVRVGASIGIVMAPQHGANPDLLLRNADVALYRAKTEGRDTFRFFDPAMEYGRRARQAVEIDLRHAIDRNELVLLFQPMVGLPGRRIDGFEALLRWNHPRHGLLNAADFIPLAEETGTILSIGDWVLRRACAAAMAWPRNIRLAVNLSPLQFGRHSLVGVVEDALRTTGIEPDRLELEITETVLLNDDFGTRSALHQLRELGARISIDDFGTGYSSLSHLRSFTVDKLKVDQGFVGTLEDTGESNVIVKAILALAEGLGIEACAEGVETEAQLNRLQALGCNQVQGWLLGRPMAEKKVQDLLDQVR